jgi:hypothetical protein
MEMRNRPFEFNMLVVYLKWTKIVEVDENCRFIIKFLKEVKDLWRKKFKLFNKGTNCLLSIENKYQNMYYVSFTYDVILENPLSGRKLPTLLYINVIFTTL